MACMVMPFTLPPGLAAKAGVKLKLQRSSRAGRFRIAVSHRGTTWTPASKDGDKVFERDLSSRFGQARPRPKRQRG
jgi:hypothetical protein